MTMLNDDSAVVNKLEASLTDNARIVIYDCHMFIVQATALGFKEIMVANNCNNFYLGLVPPSGG
jgi:hypothetical protein